jgi:hypothetical protein
LNVIYTSFGLKGLSYLLRKTKDYLAWPRKGSGEAQNPQGISNRSKPALDWHSEEAE